MGDGWCRVLSEEGRYSVAQTRVGGGGEDGEEEGKGVEKGGREGKAEHGKRKGETSVPLGLEALTS
eukprot:1984137-Rhodomonas_salina.1